MKVVDFDNENLCGPISLVLTALYYDHKKSQERLRKLFPEGHQDAPKASQQFDRFVVKKKAEDSKEPCDDEKQFKRDQETCKQNSVMFNTDKKNGFHKQ